MQLLFHRGSHQIGGMAAEVHTGNTRIIIDMGDELPGQETGCILDIPGVTDSSGTCDAVLLTHYHADHMGQLHRLRDGVPLYMGALAKDVAILALKRTRLHEITPENTRVLELLEAAHTFVPGKSFLIGDIEVTPYSVDHSAVDSYMFLLESGGRRMLYTGDFRTHGFRGKGVIPVTKKLVRNAHVLVTEGTTFSRPEKKPMTEHELQKQIIEYPKKYKYIFVCCSSTNLDRICALSKATQYGRYFICDAHQYALIELVEKHWSKYTNLYCNLKKTRLYVNKLDDFCSRGFVMTIRNNVNFKTAIAQIKARVPDFDKEALMIYSMWKGYREPGNELDSFLNLIGNQAELHASGHATMQDIIELADACKAERIVPMHSDAPEILHEKLGDRVNILKDGEVLDI